jgi:hypothetical protein
VRSYGLASYDADERTKAVAFKLFIFDENFEELDLKLKFSNFALQLAHFCGVG